VRFITIAAFFAIALPGATITLNELDRLGNEAFGKRDCKTALLNYKPAAPLALAETLPDRAGLIYRRIGICKGRLGDITGSLEAYRSGVAAGEIGADTEMLAENVHGMGLALQRLGRLSEATAPAERELALAKTCGHPQHLVRAMWLVASLYDRTGKRRISMKMYEEALVLSRQNKDRTATIILLDNLATRYAATGDTESGLRLEREAISLMKPSDYAAMSNSYNNLAEMETSSRNYSKAAEYFTEALHAAVGAEAWSIRQGALKNLADIDMRLNKYPEAIGLLDQALAEDRELKRPEWESLIQAGRSEAFLAMGNVSEASQAAAESLRLAQELGSPELLYSALLMRGQVAQRERHPSLALADFQSAVDAAESLRAEGLGDPQSLRGGFLKKLPAYRILASELIAQHKPDQAFQVAETAKARVLMDIMLDSGEDETKSMSSAEIARQKSLLARLAAANRAAAKAPVTTAKQNRDEALFAVERFRREIFTRHPELHLQSADFQVATERQLTTLLPNQKTALLEYFETSQGGLILFVVRRTGAAGPVRIQAFSLSPKLAIQARAEARAFRQQLANRDLDYQTAARHLHTLLIAPARSALAGTDSLVISPDGALWELPFAALMDSGGRYLIETHRLSITPSFTALYEMHRNRHEKWRLDLLALGAPPSDIPLPDAVREVSEIRAKYPAGRSVERTGARATAEEFRRNAPFARVIHVAAHAELNNVDPLYSSLRLAPAGSPDDDGSLTAREIMSMRLTADIVILSACETALGQARPGEGMMGMGWALSAAGASSAVLSQWKIDSASAKTFMIELHDRLTASGVRESRAESLRLSGVRQMQSPGLRHPFYWAGYILWGDGS
jgi:CHAT domain-containing protein